MPFDSETTEEALARLKSLDAPIGPVERMTEESITGRYSAMSVPECVEVPDMSKTGITRVTVKPGEPLPHGDTDWERVGCPPCAHTFTRPPQASFHPTAPNLRRQALFPWTRLFPSEHF